MVKTLPCHGRDNGFDPRRSRQYIIKVEAVPTLRNRREFWIVAPAVEQMTVNHRVVGSNPTYPARFGEMVEWSIAPVLKTGGPKGSVGSNPTLSAIIKECNMTIEKKCGCGRSPTGKCIGWHGLTNEEYLVKLDEHKKQELNESAPKLLRD